MKILHMGLMVMVCGGLLHAAHYYDRGERVELTPIPNHKRAVNGVTYYQTARGQEVGLSGQMVIKLQKGVAIQSLLQEHLLLPIRSFRGGLEVVKVQAGHDYFGILEALHHDPRVAYVEPDFHMKRLAR